MSTLLNSLFASIFSTALSPNVEVQVPTVPDNMEVSVSTGDIFIEDYKTYCYL